LMRRRANRGQVLRGSRFGLKGLLRRLYGLRCKA
jgi:hypothetical protein